MRYYEARRPLTIGLDSAWQMTATNITVEALHLLLKIIPLSQQSTGKDEDGENTNSAKSLATQM